MTDSENEQESNEYSNISQALGTITIRHDDETLSDEHENHSLFDSEDDVPLAQLAIQARKTTDGGKKRGKKGKKQSTKKDKDTKDKTEQKISNFPKEIPNFTPLAFSEDRVNQQGKSSLRSRELGIHPFDMFSKFFCKDILETIAKHTNMYAIKKGATIASGRHWKPVDATDIQMFIGVLVYMGVHRERELKDYWENDLTKPRHPISQYMSQLRFEQIKRYLHVCDPEGLNGSDFFFNKLEPLWTHFATVAKQIWKPGCRLSVDEMMVPCMGRCSETVRIKNKPIGQGFKIWALCERGYVYAFIPHSNKFKWREIEAYKGKLMHASAVVARLAEMLPPSEDENGVYQLYMDNLFTSVALFKHLRDRGIGCAGTTRANTTGFPQCLKVKGPASAKLDWDTIGCVVTDDVNCVCWIDNSAVLLLTTIHELGKEHTVVRERRRPRLTSTNGPKVQKVFGNQVRKELPIPKLIDDYNHYMGGGWALLTK